MKILIVDDSILMKERLSNAIFAIPGVGAVNYAKNTREARRALEENGFDVAILDIRLPDGSGFDVLKRIKEKHPQTLVVMLTNYPYEQYKAKSSELGADHFFDKSTEFEEVIKVIEAHQAQ